MKKTDKELIMKVYTLLFFNITDTEFGGVFSTEEAAMARGDEMEEFCTENDYDYQVIESEIDVPVEFD
jgi:hypothetical protein